VAQPLPGPMPMPEPMPMPPDVRDAPAVGSTDGDDASGIAEPWLPRTRVVQVDVAGDQLTVGEAYDLDGSYLSARMTDDVVRLVLQANPEQALPLVTPSTPNAEAEASAEEHNREVVEQATAEDLLPRWHRVGEDGGEGTGAGEGALLDCEEAHAPERFSGFGMVTVVSFDLSTGLGEGLAATDGAGVMATGETVYASPEHLYVAASGWVEPDAPSDSSPGGPRGTDIHRFDITDPSRATYDMSGHVEGMLLNQFALDEHEGHLRVAITTGDPSDEGAGESESHVVALAPTDGGLAEVGRVSGLGRGESIYAVRFMGDVGYVVTFEQTDPLYTIDLADPTAPRMAGELEMLGYSAYLHPIGEGRLIGIGQDATAEGGTLGTQVALFDVRDPAAPTRVAQATLPGGSSNAEWEHRAFLWWPETRLVAFPVSSYEGDQRFDGLVGFQVDAEAGTITEVGRVSHEVATGGPGIDEPGIPVPMPVEPGAGGAAPGSVAPSRPGDLVDVEILPRDTSYAMPILRSLVIDGQLWTVSSAGLAASDLETLGSTTFVAFP
jgi:Beta propeller domain